MNDTTLLLKRLYDDEVKDIRRVAHYNNPQLDVEEIIKRGVRLDYISTHLERFVVVVRLIENADLTIGEDYFYASFILSQETEMEMLALACMFAKVSKRLNFFGNEDIPDINEYIKQLDNAFFERVTNLE